MSDWWLAHGGWIGVAALLLALPLSYWTVKKRARKNPKYQRLVIPLVASSVLGALWLALQRFTSYDSAVERDWVLFAALAAVTVLLVRWLRVALFDFLLGGRQGREVPALLKDFLSIVAYVVLFAFVMKGVLGVEAKSLLAGSAVLTFVLGLALQEPLGNLFSGLSLHIERSFEVGDFIRVGDLEGMVEGMTWRSVKLVTTIDTHVVLPNTLVAKERLLVFRHSQEAVGGKLYVSVSYRVPPRRVEEVVREAVKSVAAVSTWREPQVLAFAFQDFAIEYEVRYWTSNYFGHNQLESAIREMIWYQFQRRNITIPYPIRDVYMHGEREQRETSRRDRERTLQMLRTVPMFEPFSAESLEAVAGDVTHLLYAPGEMVIGQDDPGESFFAIAAGQVEVLRAQPSGRQSRIALLGPGDHFGEMALLTGEPRYASVRTITDTELIEVRKPAMQRIFDADPGLAEKLSEVLGARRAQGDELVDLDSSTQHIPKLGGRKLLERIKSYFGLG